VLSRRFDAAATLAAIDEHRITCVVAVPVMFQRMLALPKAERARHDTASLRAALSAAAPLSPHLAVEFMDTFGDVLYNLYGSTETGWGSIATPADLRAAPGTVGRVPLGTTLQILDGDRRPVGPGVTGHVFIGGPLVFDGYEGGGSKELAGGLMNTGDLGHLDDAGRLFIDGREDDMIVSGGENVFPQEVADVLIAHPAVADAAVIGVPDDEFGQRLRAFVVVAESGAAPDDAELIAHVRAHVARYKLPREIVRVATIPRNPTGKILARQLSTATD
jgi:fatty-acyl-CoA synthase